MHELQAALAGRFATANDAQINYAYHLDASLYALKIRELAEMGGAKRLEGSIEQVETGSRQRLHSCARAPLGHSGRGRLFIDCTGFRALLIGETLRHRQ